MGDTGWYLEVFFIFSKFQILFKSRHGPVPRSKARTGGSFDRWAAARIFSSAWGRGRLVRTSRTKGGDHASEKIRAAYRVSSSFKIGRLRVCAKNVLKFRSVPKHPQNYPSDKTSPNSLFILVLLKILSYPKFKSKLWHIYYQNFINLFLCIMIVL